MLHRIQTYFAGVKPVYIDGALYVALAFLGAIMITFNNDDVYKYVPYPRIVFWIKSVDEWLIATLTALKMFRSTAYAEHLANKQMEKDGTKPAPVLPPVPDNKQQALNKADLEKAVIDKLNENNK